MKIIEAMKQIKALEHKAKDLLNFVQMHSSDLDIEAPVYLDQSGQVKSWIDAYVGALETIVSLQAKIQKTNTVTQVTIELGGNRISKTISEWIYRKNKIATEKSVWTALDGRRLKDSSFIQTSGTVKEVKVRRYFDPELRDRKITGLSQEPFLIDSALEVINATTDLIE
jgi:hypothetical protein